MIEKTKTLYDSVILKNIGDKNISLEFTTGKHKGQSTTLYIGDQIEIENKPRYKSIIIE